jgi:hypothetical protein
MRLPRCPGFTILKPAASNLAIRSDIVRTCVFSVVSDELTASSGRFSFGMVSFARGYAPEQRALLKN